MAIVWSQLSDELFDQLQAIAKRENLSIEQLVSQALASQVAAWGDRDYLQNRAQRGSWEHFQSVLAQVPNGEPEEYDRL
jgi:predicted DNA-binding ribbon-helix-helix protein